MRNRRDAFGLSIKGGAVPRAVSCPGHHSKVDSPGFGRKSRRLANFDTFGDGSWTTGVDGIPILELLRAFRNRGRPRLSERSHSSTAISHRRILRTRRFGKL